MKKIRGICLIIAICIISIINIGCEKNGDEIKDKRFRLYGSR